MKDEVRAFVIAQLRDMNYDTEGVDDDTTLGPAGVDLESLALADLSVRSRTGSGSGSPTTSPSSWR